MISLSDSCFIEVLQLPLELSEKSKNDFAQMFALCPSDKHRVVVKDYEMEMQRYSKSYGYTPGIKKLINTEQKNDRKYMYSYMFSGQDDSDNNGTLPEIFQPYLQFLNETLNDCNFNQVTVNWYKDGQDFISLHKDCEIGMRGNKKICILTFNETDEVRDLTLRSTEMKNGIFHETFIPLTHGSIMVLESQLQKYYKHGIRKSDCKTKRISLSFRQFEEN